MRTTTRAKATKTNKPFLKTAARARKTRVTREDLVKQMEAKEAKIRVMYGELDAMLMQLKAYKSVVIGKPFDIGDGRVAILEDNFADRNVAFRIGAIRRFELKTRKAKQAEVLRKK